MEPASKSIKSLIDQFMGGDIQLPEIQRDYVWSREKVCALVDSIYKGYPSGSILLWRTDMAGATRPAAATDADDTIAPSHLLLDGQQRLTSLAAVMKGTPVSMKVRGSVVEAPIEIYFNMDHPDAAPEPDDTDDDDPDYAGGDSRIFQLRNRKVEADRRWIPVTSVFKRGPGKALLENEVRGDDPDFPRYLDRLTTLYGKAEAYMYPVQTLGREVPDGQVADIFVRLNLQGTKLRKADLALAQVTSRWKGAMGLFSAMADECRRKKFDLDERFLIKCLVSVSTGQNKFKNVGRIPVADLKADWERTKRGLRFAIDFFKKNARIETSDVLPSPYLLIPVAYLAVRNGYRLPEGTERRLLRWVYAALMWGRYSGSTETKLDEDLLAIRGSADPLGDMVEKVRGQSGRIEVQPRDLKGKTKQSPLFSMMYVLARRANARDWGSGLILSIDSDRDFKDMHGQIFPSVAIKPAIEKGGGRDARRAASDVANTAFFSRHAAGTRRRTPDKYLPGIVGRIGAEALEAQCIPADPALWTVDRYEEFMAARREALASGINGLLSSLERDDPGPASDADVIGRGETRTVEFKSSMLYDHDRDVKNKELQRVLLKEIVALMNTDGGTVYVGVSDNGDILGIEKDCRLAGGRGGWHGWSESFVNAVKTLGPAAAANVGHEPVEIGGTTVAKITVLRGARPAYLDPKNKGQFVMRQGSSSVSLTPQEAIEYYGERFGGGA